MAFAYASVVVPATADEVWTFVRDFNDLPKWTGGIVVESEIEEGKAGDQIGAVRSFKLADGEHLRERLLAHSDAGRTYSYNFEKKPFDVDNYFAVLKVRPVTDTNEAFVTWTTSFDCDRDRIDEWEAFFADDVFMGGLNFLKEHFGS